VKGKKAKNRQRN